MTAEVPRVSIVVPNWNGMCHLPECLGALATQSFTDFKILLVDNASSDASVAWVRSNYPHVCILQRSDNGGFAKAVNTGIQATQSEYVCLLNNDTAVDARWLEKLVRALDRYPSYDFAAPRMVLYHDSERLNAAGDTYSLLLVAGKNRGLGRRHTSYDRMERVLGACAGAAIYRRSLFDVVGLFDEDFFLMAEDTDFNLRCLIAGKRCLYVPEAQVRHKLRASINRKPRPIMRLIAARNEAIVAAKDLPMVVLLVLPLFWPYRMIRQSLRLRPAQWPLVPELLREEPRRVRAELAGIRTGLAKRSDVWNRRAIGRAEILRWIIKGSGRI